MRWRTWGEPTGRLLELMTAPESVLQGDGSVARALTGRKRFFRLDPVPGEPALYVKVFPAPRGLGRLRSLGRPSKALRERRLAERIAALGFEVAAPIAVGEERRCGLAGRSLSVIPERAGRDLRSLLGQDRIACRERRALLRDLGTLARRLHDAGVDQEDFSPNNFLRLEGGGLCLLDFERCRVGSPPGDLVWQRLAKLHRHRLGVSRTDRLRLLGAYLGEADRRAARRAAWSRIRRAFFDVRAHDARRAAAAAFREGRRLERRGRVWTVRGRETRATWRLPLPARQARAAWIAAHQLERLGLPALRPVRLGPEGLELEAPRPEGSCDRGAVARARARFEGYGEFTREPEWVAGAQGPCLRDPRAFRIAPRDPRAVGRRPRAESRAPLYRNR
ncbi:MAG: lipopolysaccharide kinase InaA family protein [Myxococcota bacterium]